MPSPDASTTTNELQKWNCAQTYASALHSVACSIAFYLLFFQYYWFENYVIFLFNLNTHRALSAVPWYITRIRFAQWLYQTISVHCTATNSVFNKYYLFSAYRWSENWQFYLFLIWICNLLAVKLSFQIADCLFVLIGWAPYTQCKVFWANLGRMVDVSFIFMEILSTQREAILFCWQNIKFDCEIVGSSVWIAWVDCVFRGTFFV